MKEGNAKEHRSCKKDCFVLLVDYLHKMVLPRFSTSFQSPATFFRAPLIRAKGMQWAKRSWQGHYHLPRTSEVFIESKIQSSKLLALWKSLCSSHSSCYSGCVLSFRTTWNFKMFPHEAGMYVKVFQCGTLALHLPGKNEVKQLNQ